MRLRTEIEHAPSDWKIEQTNQIMTLGSCFSDHIGQLFLDDKLPCVVNPFGTIYNPVSITTNLCTAIKSENIDNQLFIEKETIWHHFDFHSTFWSTSQKDLWKEIQLTNQHVRETLQKTHILILTWGTSFVYRQKKTQKIVSNCHKIPSSEFEKILLTKEEILASFTLLYTTLKEVNPTLRIILTISPVRHTKDTLTLNSLSKSLLRVVCHELQETYPTVYYFPAFEIMQDDLRDYRFYEEDLIHPNKQAIEYIYTQFRTTYFSENLLKLQADWQKIKASLQHRPFYPGTRSHLLFLENLARKLVKISSQLPVENEINEVKEQIETVKQKLD